MNHSASSLRLRNDRGQAAMRRSSRQAPGDVALSFLAEIDLPMEAIEEHLLRRLIYQLDSETARYRAVLRAIKRSTKA
jgi:hypothetical protein